MARELEEAMVWPVESGGHGVAWGSWVAMVWPGATVGHGVAPCGHGVARDGHGGTPCLGWPWCPGVALGSKVAMV